MSEALDKPRCSEKNKRGDPCKAWPLKGSQLCSAHNPDSPVYAGFQAGPEHFVGPGRPAKPTPQEYVRRMFEEDPSSMMKAFLDAREAVIVLSNPREGVVVTDEADHATRLKAADSLLSWGFAKPKENATLEIGMDGAGGVVVRLAFDPASGEAA
jgi:hypothetical protein